MRSNAWVAVVTQAKWRQPAEVKARYQNASDRGNHRIGAVDGGDEFHDLSATVTVNFEAAGDKSRP